LGEQYSPRLATANRGLIIEKDSSVVSILTVVLEASPEPELTSEVVQREASCWMAFGHPRAHQPVNLE
jgi:hypothetical protein